MGRSINKLCNKKGFTLIELIVVLAVLAIIMAIAVPRFAGVRESAKVDSDMATLASIAKLAEFEYVRLNKDDDSLDADIVKDLITKNFIDSENIFQSTNLEKYEVINVNFNDGKVITIDVDGTIFTYSEGKFTPPEEATT